MLPAILCSRYVAVFLVQMFTRLLECFSPAPPPPTLTTNVKHPSAKCLQAKAQYNNHSSRWFPDIGLPSSFGWYMFYQKSDDISKFTAHSAAQALPPVHTCTTCLGNHQVAATSTRQTQHRTCQNGMCFGFLYCFCIYRFSSTSCGTQTC